ncbi:MAG: hypothetical protein IJR87_03325 [Bacteroidaceae bacterium]|nr:hypothetical protein [Bacteroidaceae bacterium]
MKQTFYSSFLAMLFSLAGLSAWALEENADGVYEIGTPQDLVAFSELLNSSAIPNTSSLKLTADIDMEGINFAPIGYVSAVEKPSYKDLDLINFRGTIDGQGHIIKNLTVVDTLYHEAGLVSRLDGGTIKNLGVVNASITSNNPWSRVAVFAGFVNSNGVISNCFATGEIELIGNAADYGQFAHDGSGGLAGSVSGLIMNNCYITYGKLIGYNWGSTITNTYADPNEDDLKSGLFCFSMNEAAGEIIYYQKLGEDDYPVLNPEHGIVYLTSDQFCDGTPKGEAVYSNTEGGSRDPHNFVNGLCTVCDSYDPDQIIDGVYQVGSPMQLIWFSEAINTSRIPNNTSFALTADINMEGFNFAPIGYVSAIEKPSYKDLDLINFRGNIDGQGHVIQNLTVVDTLYHESGLVSRLDGGTIKNLGIVNASITTNNPWGRAAVFAGFVNHNGHITNCFAAGDIELIGNADEYGQFAADQRSGLFCAGYAVVNNCYTTYSRIAEQTYLSTITNSYAEPTEEELKSGALCYNMNEAAGENVFYQTLGEDEFPVLNAERGIVYLSTDLYCDGTPKSTVKYSNTESGTRDEHIFEDGICSVCHTPDATFMTPEDGVYQIGTAAQLRWFSAAINQKLIANSTPAVLTADIDLDSQEFDPIGRFGDGESDNVQYAGHFDGMGHVVRNLKISGTGNYEIGLFARLAWGSNAWVKNLGVVGADISSSNTNARVGAVVGIVGNSCAVENCFAYDVTLAHISEIENPEFGGVVGSMAGTMTNCWTTYERVTTVTVGSASGCLTGTIDEANSGKLCFALNGNSFLNPLWYQAVGKDDYPTMDASRGLVYEAAEGQYASADESSYTDFRAVVIEQETRYCEEVIASQETINLYQAEIDKWEDVATLQEFLAAFTEAQAVKQTVINSAQVYQGYIELCEDFIGKMAQNPTQSIYSDALNEYLSKDNVQEPGTYPNGSYAYILETHLLTDEQIAEEMEYVNMLMNRVLVNNPDPGTEMTVLLNNPAFYSNFEGWDVAAQADMYVSDNKSVLPVARGRNGAFTVSQKVEGIPNGIYMVKVNSHAYADDDALLNIYTGEVFLNENTNMVMVPFEDALPEAEAQDGVNCLVSDDDYVSDEAGINAYYLPKTFAGSAVAYKAGRYQNYTAVEVTDGTITLGVRALDYGIPNWMPFADFRLYYLGNAEQANEQLSAVIDGYVTRANTICALENEYDLKYGHNISADLRTRIAAAAQEAQAAATGTQKMEAISRFTALFHEVYLCRKAYALLAKSAGQLESIAAALLEKGILSEEDSQTMMLKSIEAWSAYGDGTLTPDEAQALAQELVALSGSPAVDGDGNYLIASAKELSWFSEMLNCEAIPNTSSLKLTADIDMEGINFAPIGYVSAVEKPSYKDLDLVNFRGTIDGQGHIIKNLTVVDTLYHEAGLVSRLDGGTIKNLGVVNASITTNNPWCRTSVFAGFVNHNGTLSNCFAAGTIELIGNGADYGQFAHDGSGGLVGSVSGAILNNCYITYSKILGINWGSTVTNTYANPSDDDLTSGALCYKLNENAGETIYYQTIGTDEYPLLDPTHGIVLMAEDGSYYNDPNSIAVTQAPVRENVIYDLFGRRVEQPVRGIYIVNGKKVLFK